MYEHKLTREQFYEAYRQYMATGGYAYEEWELPHEWNRYARGRSWFIPWFHGERALAVIAELTEEVV